MEVVPIALLVLIIGIQLRTEHRITKIETILKVCLPVGKIIEEKAE